jgi:hypothetical protein
MSKQLPSFEDIDEEESNNPNASYIPFQFREEQDDDEATLSWLNDNFDAQYQNSKDRLMTYRRLASRYKNAGDSALIGFARDAHRDVSETSDKPKVKTNFFVEYLDQKVAQVSKQKLNPTFIPLNHSEQDDLNNADACTLLVKFRMKELGFPALMREQDRKTFKYGHSFAKVYWDECAGPVSKKFEKAEEEYGEIPVYDENDKPVKGSKLTKYEAKVGDVGIKVIDSDCLFPERKKKKWVNVDYVDEAEFVNISELAAQYPDAKITKEEYFWLDVDNKGYNQDDTVLKHTFYHRPTKYLPHGEIIVYIEAGILERIREPKEIRKHMPDGELPFVPDTDIDVDDEFWARPFLINIEQSNNMYDLVQSGLARNIGVASAPKLLLAEGSVNLKQADNRYGVMQWRGPHKPEWLQHNYVNRGEFEIQDRLEKRMDKAAKVYDISKGQVPAGITATSALRLLDDQEIQANSESLEKRRERIKKIYWKAMKSMEVNYDPDDERMTHILGEDNQYLIESFAKYDFGKIYSVDIEYISALSDTRSGRISDIIDLNAANQKEPTFGRKEIIKLLDLGLEKAFMDEISYATVTAKTLLENLKQGKTALSPEETDDLIEMYTIFSRYVESISYKMKLKTTVKNSIKEYIKGLEYLMAEKSKKNMLFAMKVKEFPKYPMFYTPGSVLTAPPPPMPPGAPGAPMPGGPAPAPGPQGPAGGNKAAGIPSLNEKAQGDLKNMQAENGGIA